MTSQHFTPKTFGRKAVRLSQQQRHLVAHLLPRYEIPFGERVYDLSDRFAGDGPLHLEIGFGSGEYTARLAQSLPDHCIVGCEVFLNGIARLVQEIDRVGISNIRIIHGDAVRVLKETFPAHTFDFIHINHPDPWPKTRHHKRRLIQPRIVELLAGALKPGGEVWLCTDVADYANWMEEVFGGNELFERLPADGRFLDHLPEAAASGASLTRYEEKGRTHGRFPRHLLYRRL